MSYDTWKTTELDAPADDTRLMDAEDACERSRAMAALELRYQAERVARLRAGDEDISRATWYGTLDDQDVIDTLTDGWWGNQGPLARVALRRHWADRCKTW